MFNKEVLRFQKVAARCQACLLFRASDKLFQRSLFSAGKKRKITRALFHSATFSFVDHNLLQSSINLTKNKQDTWSWKNIINEPLSNSHWCMLWRVWFAIQFKELYNTQKGKKYHLSVRKLMITNINFLQNFVLLQTFFFFFDEKLVSELQI